MRSIVTICGTTLARSAQIRDCRGSQPAAIWWPRAACRATSARPNEMDGTTRQDPVAVG